MGVERAIHHPGMLISNFLGYFLKILTQIVKSALCSYSRIGFHKMHGIKKYPRILKKKKKCSKCCNSNII